MQINPNAGLYDAWTGLHQKVETGREKGRYRNWYQEMIEHASAANMRAAGWSALGIINPGLGLIGRTISTALDSANMPEAFELDPGLIYSDPTIVGDYASGSQEAIYELEHSLWSGLLDQTNDIFQLYGSPFADILDKKGKVIEENAYQWGTQFGGREHKFI